MAPHTPIPVLLGGATSAALGWEFIHTPHMTLWGFPGGPGVKGPPALQETRVQFLSEEDLLEEGMSYPPQVFLLGEFHG